MRGIRRIKIAGSSSNVERLTETIKPHPPRTLESVLSEILDWYKKLGESDPENKKSYELMAAIMKTQSAIEREALDRLMDRKDHFVKIARQVPRKRKPLIDLIGGLPTELLDNSWLKEKLLELIATAKENGMKLDSKAAPIESPIERGLIHPSQVIAELLLGREDLINAWAASVSAPRETVKALVFWLLQPLLSALKNVASKGIKTAQELWQRGECPVCGTPASLGFQKGEGRHQFMRCRVCGLEWRFPRARCPMCNTDEPGAIVFYTPLPDKPWLRLYRCKKCGWLWKIVDEEHKEASKHGLPPHEIYDILTVQLDFIQDLIPGVKNGG